MTWLTDFDPKTSDLMVRAAYDNNSPYSTAVIEGVLMPTGEIAIGTTVADTKPIMVPAIRQWSDGTWHTVSGAKYVSCLWDRKKWQIVPISYFNPYSHTPFAVVVNGQRYEHVAFIYGESYRVRIEDGDYTRIIDAKDVSYCLKRINQEDE